MSTISSISSHPVALDTCERHDTSEEDERFVIVDHDFSVSSLRSDVLMSYGTDPMLFCGDGWDGFLTLGLNLLFVIDLRYLRNFDFQKYN